jgi:hypothetical protein
MCLLSGGLHIQGGFAVPKWPILINRGGVVFLKGCETDAPCLIYELENIVMRPTNLTVADAIIDLDQ